LGIGDGLRHSRLEIYYRRSFPHPFVWKHAANANAGAWTRVLYPVPDPPNPADQSAYNNICNDVAIQPNRGGQHVLANCAWRDGAAYNGFYYSVDGGASFARINPTGG
jgi:hypothetical protein